MSLSPPWRSDLAADVTALLDWAAPLVGAELTLLARSYLLHHEFAEAVDLVRAGLTSSDALPDDSIGWALLEALTAELGLEPLTRR